MGNACKTLSFCNCMFPSNQIEGDDHCRSNKQNHYNQPKLSKSRAKKCSVFAITTPSTFQQQDYSTPIKQTSMCDLQLNINMIDDNLSQLSKQLYGSTSSFCEQMLPEMDSGYDTSSNSETLSVPSKFDIFTINLESITHYSADFDIVSVCKKKNRFFSFDLVYASLFNMNYFLNSSFNSLMKKSALRHEIFTSKFITTMKSKLVETPNKPVENIEAAALEQQQQLIQFNRSTELELNTFTYLSFSRAVFGAFTLSNIVSRIYDINYF